MTVLLRYCPISYSVGSKRVGGGGGVLNYDADEVVERFGSSLSSIINLLGGSFGLDLNDIFAGVDTGFGLDSFSIAILDSQKIYDFYDQWPEGLYSVSINLWDYSETE